MTPAGRAAVALYGVLLTAAATKGGMTLEAGDKPHAAQLYAVGLVCVVAMCRECSRSVLEPPREPGRLTTWWYRTRATRQARRILRAAECTCDAVWWPDTPHEPYCPSAQNRNHHA